MAKKHNDGYLSAKESRRISKENRKITNALEKKRKRKNVPESEYLTEMHDPNNAVEFDNLHTYFFTDTGVVKSVDGVTFSVPIGKTVGVVGESGCGKSVTSLSLMQLLQRPQGQVVEGEIRLNLGSKAYDVTKAPDSVMQHLRGNYISMIFQEPMVALNPVLRIGQQITESFKEPGLSGEEKHARAESKGHQADTDEYRCDMDGKGHPRKHGGKRCFGLTQQEGDQKRQQGEWRHGQEQCLIAPPEPRDKPAEGNAPSQKLDIHGAGQARESVVHKGGDQQ